MMKLTRMISLLLALVLLAGCTGGQTEPTAAPTQPAASTAPAETEPVTEPTVPPTEMTPEGVNLLSNRKFIASPFVAVLDERTVAFLNTEYDRSRAITVSHLMVLDLYTDTVLAEKTYDLALKFPVQSQLPGVLPTVCGGEGAGLWLGVSTKRTKLQV